ncbi:MAG TPA: DNA replication/repair protein RecF, partial [Actinobacteria bacterium]|nr:DNA replication/repair protein RecF [Actinomycetota bacterium]
YDDIRWEPHPDVNVLVGPNAIGKTNLLEGVGYLARLRSFRGVPDQILIREGSEGAFMRGMIARSDSEALVEIEIPLGGRRRAQVNRQRLVRVADMLGHVRSVTFLPDDLDIIKRSPGYRRDLLDDLAVQVWPVAFADQQDYDKALKQRNSLLRQSGTHVDETTLDVWDERLSQAGGKVMQRRSGAMSALQPHMSEMYNRLANSEIEVGIEYRSTWGSDDGFDPESWTTALREALAKSRKSDTERRVTTVGLHRDDPAVRLGGKDSRTMASQGEQRTLALSLRLASHRAIEEAIGEPPLLLLDDVFSELDLRRANALADALPDAQTLITTARDEEVPVRGRRWKVGKGTVT